MTAIRLLRSKFRLSFLLKAAGMARSTFYYGVAAYGKDDKYATVIKLISDIYHLHKGRYGYRRIRLELKRKGYQLNGKTVLRLMRICGLKSRVRPKKFRSYKGDVGRIAPNIMRRDFSAEAPNRKWVTDITQFTLLGQRCYLSTVMDLFNQEIVAYTISSSCSLKLVTTMLKKAFSTVKDLEGLMLHSDQGWHYQHANYRRMLSARGIVQSMSRKGNCLDNAVMENFFGHLKSELLYLHEFCSWDDFIRELKRYIVYYNNDRIKVSFNGLSPIEYKNKYYNELI